MQPQSSIPPPQGDGGGTAAWSRWNSCLEQVEQLLGAGGTATWSGWNSCLKRVEQLLAAGGTAAWSGWNSCLERVEQLLGAGGTAAWSRWRRPGGQWLLKCSTVVDAQLAQAVRYTLLYLDRYLDPYGYVTVSTASASAVA